MRKIKLLVGLGLFLFLLTACISSAATPDVKADTQSETNILAATAEPTDTADVPVAEAASPEKAEDYCRECHTDKQKLIDTMRPVDAKADQSQLQGMLGKVPPKEPWEKVLIDPDFNNTVHGHYPCVNCHGGVQSSDKDTAHQNVIRNPSENPQATCGECHRDLVANAHNNMHVTVAGFSTILNQRTGPQSHPAIDEALQNSCNNCHVTCGECHVSQPRLVGGGFVDGHMINRRPSMIGNCDVCHASRVGNEFLGNNEGLNADVHYTQGGMECVTCHLSREMHGSPAECNSCHQGPPGSDVPPPDHRYDGIQAPRCETCHANVSSGKDDVVMHQMHGATLSCQVCHSIAYNNCDGCHVGKDKQAGEPAYTLDASYFGFLIGRNPNPSYERPYQYVPVRHVPVTPDSFAAYGQNLLPRFDQVETWKYTTPHNIQLKTPQTKSCNTCHGNPEFFLTADKVNPEELKANQDVIVNQMPPLISSGDQIP